MSGVVPAAAAAAAEELTAADIPAVYGLLEGAVSQEQGARSSAEAALATCETRVGFCSCLLEIIVHPELQLKQEPRWLAAVYFKNSINRYWRARRESVGIGDSEKPHLRAKLLELIINEPNPQVVLQLVIVASKIARIDFPKAWPELVPAMVQGVQLPELQRSQRAFLLLHHVLKELSTKRLGIDQKNFAQATAQLFDPAWACWAADSSTLVQGLTSLLQPRTDGSGAAAAGGGGSSLAGLLSMSADEQQALWLTCERWMLSLKCVRRMLLSGHPSDFKQVQEVAGVKQVCPPFLEAMQAFLRLLPACARLRELGAGTGTLGAEAFLCKAAQKVMKTLVKLLETHPYSCASAGAIPPTLDFCFDRITADARMAPAGAQLASDWPGEGGASGAAAAAGGGGGRGDGLDAWGGELDDLKVQCMLYMHGILGSLAFKQTKAGKVLGPNHDGGGDVLSAMEEARGRLCELGKQQIREFFTQDRVGFLARVLIHRYMVLTARDLEAWSEDAEAFHHEQDAIQWRDRLRPCAEALYLLLFENFKDVLAPTVMDILRRASEACPPPAAADAEVAVTPALLLKEASYDAVGAASYDLHDLVDLESWYQSTLSLEIANRRCNGKILRRKVAWLLGQWVSKIKDSMRKPVYAGLVALLADGDVAVQLAAVGALRALVDDVNFYEDEFLEFVEPSLSMLFALMNACSQFESQLQTVNLISLIIERTGEKIVPSAEKILAQLPQVWEASEGESLLRIQVMLALQRLLVALGPQSPLCYPILFPILRYSTDVSQPDELNMLEDGLSLWSASLRYAPAMVPPLMELFPNLVPVMERGFEHLPVAVRIMESYVLVGGNDFLSQHAARLVHILQLLVGNVKEKGMMIVMGLVDLLVQCYPAEAPAALETILQRLLVIVVGPTDYSDVVRGTAATVLARVVLQNAAFFARFVASPVLSQMVQEQSAARGGMAPFFLFLDTWLDKVDSVSVGAKRKLSALALSMILTMNEPQILNRMEQIISVCTSVLNEDDGASPEQTSIGYDFLGTTAADDAPGGSVECEYARRLQVAAADPVNRVAVVSFVREKLQACMQVHGDAAFNTAMARVHPSMLAMLQQ